MKIFLGFLFQFSIHQEIGVAKTILIDMRTNRYYVWLLMIVSILLLELLFYYYVFYIIYYL